MNNFKKIIAAITVATLILTSMCVVFADNDASTLTDINNSWAKQYITNVYNKGLMDSVEGTLFKPNDNVKKYDVIVSISRMMRADKVSDINALEAKYKVEVLDKYKVPDYARQAVAFCLEKQIITVYDVQWFNDFPNVQKIEASLYLGRAFGVQYDPTANPPVVLSFKDLNEIPVMYRSHVEFLTQIGVVDGVGDANGNFNPRAIIQRSVFAKMLDISNASYEKDYLKLEEPTDTDDNPVDVPDTENNDTDEDTQDETNDDVVDSDEDENVDEDVITNEGILEGYIQEVIPEYGNITIGVKQEDGTTINKVFGVAQNIKCTIDEVDSFYWRLKKGDIVTLDLKDGEIVNITAESKVQKIKASIKDVRIADEKIIIEVQTDKGEKKSFALTNETIIIKDGKEAAYQDLKAGMSISIITSYQELIEINADVTKSSDRGVIESISFSRTAPAKIVIKREDGQKVEYYIKSNITDENIIIEGEISSLYGLRPNMLVDFSLENDEVTKIVTVVSDTRVNIISATVKEIVYDKAIIVIEYFDNTNKLITKHVYATNAKIVDKSLNTLTIQDIKKGSKIFSIIGEEEVGMIIAETIIMDK